MSLLKGLVRVPVTRRRCVSSFILRKPADAPRVVSQQHEGSGAVIYSPRGDYPREAPTPLLFVSAKSWDPGSYNGINAIATTLAFKGFFSMHCDISLPSSPSSPLGSAAIMDYFVSRLNSDIRLSGHTSFPPVIFARSYASLIAQAYISSNPASGMMLMGNIPATNSEVPVSLLPTPFEEFTFEPTFPIAILTTSSETERLQKTSRLYQAPGVETIVVDDLESQDALLEIEHWLDDLGI